MADYVIIKGNVVGTTVDGVKPLISRYTASEAITAGQAVALLASDGSAVLNDIADPLKQDLRGMALNDCAIGQPIDVIEGGYVNVGAVAVAGDVAVGSTQTVGAVSSWVDLITADVVSVLGFFVSDSILKIDISNLGIAKG